MSAQPESLWPDDFGTTQTTPPVVILKEQAALLGPLTKNIVEGRVRSMQDGGRFMHDLFLFAPALSNYSYELVRMWHDLDFYPADLIYLPTSSRAKANTEAELKDHLRTFFAEPKTRSIISALISQSKNA
jgi:hypothetical protein